MNYLAPLPEDTVYHDLWEALEAREVDKPNITFDRATFRQEEKDLLSPALEKAGYILHGEWFDGERDSFGPLSRCIHATSPYSDKERVVIVYG